MISSRYSYSPYSRILIIFDINLGRSPTHDRSLGDWKTNKQTKMSKLQLQVNREGEIHICRLENLFSHNYHSIEFRIISLSRSF